MWWDDGVEFFNPVEIAKGNTAYKGDDFEPGTPGDVWNKTPLTFTFPLYDTVNKKYETVDIKAFHATTKLIGTHCKDSQGALRKHVHFERDYTDAERTKANDYWDKVFKDCTRKLDASNKTNCFEYALKTFVKKGTYEYWMTQKHKDSAEVDAVFDVETSSFAKESVETNDVLFYRMKNHATGVVKATANKLETLGRKWNGSGTYELATNSFHTPYLQPKGGKDIGPVEADLDPTGKVRRAK